MDHEALRELKREISKDIEAIKQEHRSFKRRVSVISNLFIPGIGFIIYGSAYLKGWISLALFILYNLLYFTSISPSLGELSFRILYYIPAIAVWIISTVMVGSLDD